MRVACRCLLVHKCVDRACAVQKASEGGCRVIKVSTTELMIVWTSVCSIHKRLDLLDSCNFHSFIVLLLRSAFKEIDQLCVCAQK
jgi:hypothetical protein